MIFEVHRSDDQDYLAAMNALRIHRPPRTASEPGWQSITAARELKTLRSGRAADTVGPVSATLSPVRRTAVNPGACPGPDRPIRHEFGRANAAGWRRHGAITPCASGRRARVAALFLMVALCLAGADALAHAIVVGTSLEQSPIKPRVAASVVLHFNSGIEIGLSRVFLVTAGEAQQALPIQAGARPGELVVAVPALAAGDYALKYRVFAVDGHLTEDVIRFRVAK